MKKDHGSPEYSQVGFAVAAEKSPILTDFLHTLTSLKTACIAGCRSIKLLAGCPNTQLIPLAHAKRIRRATRAHIVFPALTDAADSSPSGDVADRRVLPLDLSEKDGWGVGLENIFSGNQTIYGRKNDRSITIVLAALIDV